MSTIARGLAVLTPVENADRPFVFAGFSVLPPRGASWVVLPPEGSRVQSRRATKHR